MKKGILIVLSLLVVGGLTYYFVSKKKANSVTGSNEAETGAGTETGTESTTLGGLLGFIKNAKDNTGKITIEDAIQYSKEIANLLETNKEQDAIRAEELKQFLLENGYSYTGYGEVTQV